MSFTCSKYPVSYFVLPVFLGLAFVAGSFYSKGPAEDPPAAGAETEIVGRQKNGRIVLPVSQILSPVGRQVELPGLRPQVLAMSPDGRWLLTSGKTAELLVIDPDTGDVAHRTSLPPDHQLAVPQFPKNLKPDEKGQASYTGIAFSLDGSRVYLSNVDGNIKVFSFNSEGVAQGLYSIPLPSTGLVEREQEIPSGIRISRDGKKLYVVLNLSNQLMELDLASGTPLRTFEVGVAPYDVELVGDKAYVSNWGGRRPGPNDTVGPAGRGTKVRVDPERFIASEGSVSVVGLSGDTPAREILVGLHSSGLALSPDRKYLAVANAASDSVSIIDTAQDAVVETISLRWQPDDYFGASPNALTFSPDGSSLFVCNGTQNAVAVVNFRPGSSKIAGLIPVGWFPGAILQDPARNLLYVANIKGVGSGRRTFQEGEKGFNSHQYFGSLSLVPTPNSEELAGHTRTVLENCRREILEASQLPPRPEAVARPIPERVGEPSVFEHVVYIIKENRTYDQVLGDMKEGDGDPELCVFGEEVTPNQHKMARDFVLLDNTYCSGILSADGHQWATSAFSTDYMEKSFAGFPRSYPDGMGDEEIDALAYAPSGFIWDHLIAKGLSLRVYGEFAIAEKGWKDPERKPEPGFLDFFRDFSEGTGLTYAYSRPAIESLKPYLVKDTVGWAMEIPDVYRAAQFIRELEEFEKNGNFPQLVVICLPNDHGSGTKPGFPTPAAHVADNDLAFGRIVEAISRSRFWEKTCIFAIEDDPQDGWDHVSAFRTTAFVISPYTKRGAVVSTQFNQPGLLRSIELILGLPPMNMMDAVATPFFDCFVDKPDLTPYSAVPNRISLTEMNPPASAIADPLLRHYAELSDRLPLDKVDQCPEGVLNRIIWHNRKGSAVPYPDWAAGEEEDDEAEEGLPD